jgi:hypothetical protein
MLAGENLMNKGQKAPSAATKGEQDRASGSLAESSVNEAPATPGGPPARDEGHHKIPQNDQREGLEKAEQAGKNPAKP